ncbi:MAG: DUF2156 domain-containing protein [Armatimonadota bacterium]
MTGFPSLPEMRPLTLADREAVSFLIRQHPRQQSELTFTNLFIWRDAYQLQLSEVAGALAIFSWRADPEDSFLFPPLGQADAATVRRCLEHMRASGHRPVLARATREDLGRLALAEAEFVVEPDRDNWDYVYLVKDLIELSGNRYHRKRNHLEQFRSQFGFAYHELTPELVPACRELQDKWCDEKHCDLVATLRAESSAVKEVLDNFEALGVTGGCIEIDGRIEAFTLGELLNPDTVVIHIEKANAAFHGLYQMISQQFLEHEWQHTTYVNREQDLGIEGLRKAKESYYPHHMVEKLTARLR